MQFIRRELDGTVFRLTASSADRGLSVEHKGLLFQDRQLLPLASAPVSESGRPTLGQSTSIFVYLQNNDLSSVPSERQGARVNSLGRQQALSDVPLKMIFFFLPEDINYTGDYRILPYLIGRTHGSLVKSLNARFDRNALLPEEALTSPRVFAKKLLLLPAFCHPSGLLMHTERERHSERI